MSDKKPIHAKPNLYSFYYQQLKEIALRYGYNLVVHGSMNRDLDLIAIPWEEKVGNPVDMIKEFANILGGKVQDKNPDSLINFAAYHHGRIQWVIDLNRGGYYSDGIHNIDKGSLKYEEDTQYYIDVSVMPAGRSINEPNKTIKLDLEF